MQNGGRKRIVSACIPCYTKKQKCNRRYPCNNCSRRRQPEECTYNPFPGSQSAPNGNRSLPDARAHPNGQSQNGDSDNEEPTNALKDWSTRCSARLGQQGDSLSEVFGYVQHSESNTMALVRRLGLGDDDSWVGTRELPSTVSDEIERIIRRLPDRQIFDFLVQYYVTEVHWMEQVVYAPWFLGQYQSWWNQGRPHTVFDLEFAVLFLRTCCYASQCLPSPSYTLDRIRGMPLADIREACLKIAEKLAAISVRLDARGTLIRVQTLQILALLRQCEGRFNDFWEALGDAVRVAQRIGLHRGRSAWVRGMHEFDKEIRCRVFCNLYTWDSLVSRQLDCPPFLSADLTAEHLPNMNLSANVDDADAPDVYSERVLQARLASFWRSFVPRSTVDYEPTVAEERYEKFCSDYLPTLPPAFALKPCEDWDDKLTKLPLQRQILHVAIYESLCYNFRPVLLGEPAHLQGLPAYKQVLMASQRRALAAAALKVIDGVAKLHSLLGRSHTRLATIILPTFEAAVVLVSLNMDKGFPGMVLGEPDSPVLDTTSNFNPLGEERTHLTRERCHEAIQAALARLEMLAEVSNTATAGARTLTKLMAKLPSEDEILAAQWPQPVELYDTTALDDFFARYSSELMAGSPSL